MLDEEPDETDPKTNPDAATENAPENATPWGWLNSVKAMEHQLRGMHLLVLGAGGMLGRAVHRQAVRLGMFSRPALFDASDIDLVMDELRALKPDYVVNCAGHNGGIAFDRPFSIFQCNTAVPLAVLEAVARVDPGIKVLMPVASCGYDEPNAALNNCDRGGRLEESGYLKGAPNESVRPHGYAKRNTVLACRYAADQFGITAVTVCPPTLYGPGDRYEKARSKFPAATVRRLVDAVDAKQDSVTFWGTGRPTREVMFVDDAALTMLHCLAAYDDTTLPLNIGHQGRYEIREFVGHVAGVVGYGGQILWDETRPDGQRAKLTSKARFWARMEACEPTDFRMALWATIADYRDRKAAGEFKDD